MKGLLRSLSRGAPQAQNIIKKVIEIRDVVLDVDGATGDGFATAVVGDFPEGNILLLGAVSYVGFAGTGSQGALSDTWSGAYAIGTTATVDATLSGFDAIIIDEESLGPASSEVVAATRGEFDAAFLLDNTDGSLEINLNMTVADADISADDQVLTANGEIYLAYIVLGDD